MPQRIHADRTASVTELKRDPMGTLAAAEGHAIAILNRNRAASIVCLWPHTKRCWIVWKMQS